MRFIDTNFFLRYLTRDEEEKAYAVLELLKRIERNEEKVITSPLVMFELVFTLQSFYNCTREEIRDLVLPLISLRGLKLPFKKIFERALIDFPEKQISFADIFNYHFMIEHGIREIYSFDRDFDKFKDISRITLSEKS
ncbi:MULTISPECIES: PIN domain-containing protein [Thermodesulfovibrio]|uniref:PIN domain, putative n=1 Tax=Thermodesulfovibrio yellowstonii (strain ATCC 51303 / DSM 11347 / YP87) TaxID=289376 RepID=B5YIC6_THEYD|nr:MULTISPECIES: PIN domain-containing protein [Thermodesulfovibrio]ACI21128.1 PIN domain, putative [Thermodesulfovibrio yellowstonii DSM 11347]